MYLNETQKTEVAARLATLPADHIERVLFDKTFSAAVPGAVAGKYADGTDALSTALGIVASFLKIAEAPLGDTATSDSGIGRMLVDSENQF